MKLNRMTWMAAVLGAVAVTGMTGCGKAPNGSGTGAATLNVRSLLQVTDAKSAKVVVAGAAESVNLTIPLVANSTSSQWSAVVSDLPIGTDYVFTASAFAADGTTALYTGSVTGQVIIKNQTASIVIDMNQYPLPVTGLYDEAPVIAGLTETASCVAKNDTVTIKATAYDPDNGDTAGMAWHWTVDATCGTLSAPINVAGTSSTNPGTSTVIFTATASSATCQVNLTIADARQPAVLITTGSVTISIGDTCAFGNAKITAIPNTCPVVANIGASVVPVQNTPSYVPMVVGQSTFVSVSATDADNDTLIYSWSSPDCAGGTSSTTYGNWNDSTAKAGTWFLLTSAPPSGGCTFLVNVSDGTFADGKAKCNIVNHLSLPVKGPGDTVKGNPVFGFDYMSTDTVSDNDPVKLEIVAPNTGCDTAYTLVWSPAGTPLATLDPPFTTGITLNAATGAGANGETVTVTATCPSTGLSTVHSFILVGTNAVCNGAADGTICTSTAQLTDKCVTLAKCATGQCVAQTSVTCPASTVACQDNVCGHTTDGLCHLQASSDGTNCTDGLACTTGDKCAIGVCGGTAVVCTATGSPCTVNACTEPNGTCVAAASPDGTVCSDANGCSGVSAPVTGSDPGTSSTTTDSCQAGVCTAGPVVTCQSSADVCTSVTASTYSCGPKQCDVFAWAQMLIPPLGGLGISATGTPWITGSLYTPFNFGSGSVSSTGNADMYLAKIDPATGLATSTFLFGDKNSSAQVGTGVAVASGGNVGVMGTFSGEIDFTANNSDGSGASGNPGTAGVDFLQNAGSISFYGVFDGSGTADAFGAPTTIKNHMVDIGTGALLSIASNPGQNLIAYCGKTSKIVPTYSNSGATKGVLTAAGGGGNTAFGGGNYDLVVFLVDASTGLVKWGKQYGGAGDQVCESVAIDNSGNVMIAGTFFGSLFSMTAPGGGDVSGGTSALFMAKLNATDGTLASAQTWTAPVGSVSHAYGLTVDTTGNIIMGGAIGSAYNFGTGAVAYTGLNDAFVAKFNSSMVALWAKSDGDAGYDQTVKAVATDSAGNITLVGSFKGTLPAFGLTDSSNAALDAFQVALSADGTVLDCAHSYGDAAGAQAMSMVAIASSATGSLKNAVFVGGADSGRMVLNSLTSLAIDTGSPSTAYSFFARAAENF